VGDVARVPTKVLGGQAPVEYETELKSSLREPVPDTSEPWTNGSEIYKVIPSPGAADAGDTGPENTREIATTDATERLTNFSMSLILGAGIGLS
jgi:hypothetical protein